MSTHAHETHTPVFAFQISLIPPASRTGPDSNTQYFLEIFKWKKLNSSGRALVLSQQENNLADIMYIIYILTDRLSCMSVPTETFFYYI